MTAGYEVHAGLPQGEGAGVRVLDLFSGIGGFALGLERAGFKTAAFVEIDPFCQRVLTTHWPGVPIHQNIQSLPLEGIGSVDVVCGGFPCQPFSNASRGRRTAIDLWPEMQRVVAAVQPKIVIAENVSKAPIERAASFFRSMGLSCNARRISAHDIGADHLRDRWWAIAHPYEDRELHRALDAEMAVLLALRGHLWGAQPFRAAVRTSDGLSNRVDRRGVKALGNAVLPQIPEAIGRALLATAARRGVAA